MLRIINRFMGIAMAGLTAAAVREQMRRPPESRTWYGNIFGVPYDFRPPTLERVRSSLWNPGNPSLLSPTIFGVGWTINLYRLANPTQP